MTDTAKLLDEIREELMRRGAIVFGTSYVGDLAQARGLTHAITIGYKLLDEIVDDIDGAPTYEYFHHYRTLNATLDQMSLFVATRLEQAGARARVIPASQSNPAEPFAAAFPHKTAAVRAGLGYVGKSCLFVSTACGPRLRLATVLTDLALPYAAATVENACGDCMACVRACPAGALTGTVYEVGMPRSAVFDAEKCSRHMKQAYGAIGRGAVCGVCMAVCPKGKRRTK